MLQVIAGHDRHDPTTRTAVVPDYSAALTKDIEGARLGIPQEFYFEQLDPEARVCVRAALQTFERAGAQLEEISLPFSKYAAAAGRIIALTESAEIHEPFLKRRSSDYSSACACWPAHRAIDLRQALSEGAGVRSLIRQEMAAALRRVDALVTPTAPIPGAENRPGDGGFQSRDPRRHLGLEPLDSPREPNRVPSSFGAVRLYRGGSADWPAAHRATLRRGNNLAAGLCL